MEVKMDNTNTRLKLSSCLLAGLTSPLTSSLTSLLTSFFIPESWQLAERSCQGRVHTQKLYTEGSFADSPY